MMAIRLFFSRQTIVFLILALSLLIGLNIIAPQPFQGVSVAPYRLTPQFMKFASLGHWPAVVDGLWIQAIQLSGAENLSPQGLAEMYASYELASDLDPDFYELYEHAGVYFSFFAEDSEKAVHFFQKGISLYERGTVPEAFWTHPASLYIYLAYVYAFQMNDWTRAKNAYLRAADAQNAPQYLQQMKLWLKKENSEERLAKQTLNWMMNTEKDPTVRLKIQEKLRQYE